MRFPDRDFRDLSEIAESATTRIVQVPLGQLCSLLNWVRDLTERDDRFYRERPYD